MLGFKGTSFLPSGALSGGQSATYRKKPDSENGRSLRYPVRFQPQRLETPGLYPSRASTHASDMRTLSRRHANDTDAPTARQKANTHKAQLLASQRAFKRRQRKPAPRAPHSCRTCRPRRRTEARLGLNRRRTTRMQRFYEITMKGRCFQSVRPFQIHRGGIVSPHLLRKRYFVIY